MHARSLLLLRRSETLRRTRDERTEILDHILEYYRLHTQGMGDLKSLSVLKEVFD
ncbi:MAG: hypothetical protein M0P12_07940 [Paludibacteraceae bacterium]|nr:hypothetical protein [Paludibacteraceae bacterium]